MIFSEQWLREWVNPSLSSEMLAEQLTMAGLEVDAITPVAGSFEGVVVAEIVSAEQHPDADKLRVCTVNAGDETVQIVCGAPNARVGLKAPLARLGAVLPGNFKIKKAKLRGLESQGMLCAAAELTLSEEKDGLLELAPDAPVGQDLRDYLALDDVTLELGLTPNRADCLGIAGIARDVAVLNQLMACEPTVEPIPPTIDTTFPVEVTASAQCPRYLGRVIENVDLTATTPLYMAERLRRSGLRTIDPVVDVTNYVMLEMGQPLHAFDLDTLSGGILVRESMPDESMTLLDGSEITLTEGTLVIADQQRPLALAGIMGGANSGVTAETRSIFLESAFFTPTAIAGRARSYGLHTDASHRYERGVDWQLQRRAIERATELLLAVAGGSAGAITEVVSSEDLPLQSTLVLRAERVERVLGLAMPEDEVTRILQGLGFTVTFDGSSSWSCVAPSWRFDMSQEVDLIEELARVHGYNRLPTSHIEAKLQISPVSEALRSLRTLRQGLVARGFQEAITFSFVAPEQQAVFWPEAAAVKVKNPISSEMSEMRLGLLTGLAGAVAHNVKRQNSRVRLFETGNRFTHGQPYSEQVMLGIAISGTKASENWADDSSRVDFFDMKGEIEQILMGAEVTFTTSCHAGLHDGQTADIRLNGSMIGYLGTVHPQAAKLLDIPANTVFAELDLNAVRQGRVPSYEDISRFPETRRDIAVVVRRELEVGEVLSAVRDVAGPALADLNLFDIYTGSGVSDDQKSVALGLTFRDRSRTLDDEEVSAIVNQVIDFLKENFDAELRA
jgi:phenylalanyl-tRNA synthetase beta chain